MVRIFCNICELDSKQCVLWAHAALKKRNSACQIQAGNRQVTIPIENLHYKIPKEVNPETEKYTPRFLFEKFLSKCFAFHPDADTSIFI
jgi:hypothetical protein